MKIQTLHLASKSIIQSILVGPSLDLTKLFVNLGGSLGLWLGLRLLQLYFSVLDHLKYFKPIFSSSQI